LGQGDRLTLSIIETDSADVDDVSVVEGMAIRPNRFVIDPSARRGTLIDDLVSLVV
jgi:hypothetical protein